jgi:ligand-binding sensor domain-containing protein
MLMPVVRRCRYPIPLGPRCGGACAAALLLLGPTSVAAQVAAVRHYTSADGLSHEQVGRVRLDCRGFLWLGTNDGVTQFDGQRFRTYTTRDGLPDPVVNDVYEDRHGRLWIATNGGGAAVLRPVAPPGEPTRLFDTYGFGDGRPANRVNTFAETGDGTLWAATDVGLFKLVPQPEAAFARVPLPAPTPPSLAILDLAVGKAPDRLWMATSIGLLEWRPDGRVLHYPSGAPNPVARAVALTADGLVWTSHADGLYVWRPRPGDATAPVETTRITDCVVRESGVRLPSLPGRRVGCSPTGLPLSVVSPPCT